MILKKSRQAPINVDADGLQKLRIRRVFTTSEDIKVRKGPQA